MFLSSKDIHMKALATQFMVAFFGETSISNNDPIMSSI